MEIEITIINYRCFSESNPAKFLLRDGTTAFIGVNNSGKSSLLRFFYEFRDLFRVIRDQPNALVRALDKAGVEATSRMPDADSFCDRTDSDIRIEFKTEQQFSSYGVHPLDSSKHVVADRLALTIPRNQGRWYASLYIPGQPSALAVDSSDELFVQSRSVTRAVFVGHFLDVFRRLSNTFYIGPFRNALNAKPAVHYFDIEVGQTFIEQWQRFKTGESRTQALLIYNLVENIRQMFEYRHLEVSASTGNTDMSLIVDGRSYKLSDMGAGLAQFIVVLGTVAFRKPDFVLIDEPELNLHPSLQLDFLSALESYATRGMLFATHSIGLARAYADRAYSIRRQPGPDGALSLLEQTPLAEFLGELGYSAYRELGFDKVLLVEGVSEIKTIQQFLRKLRKDHRIVLIHMGGNDLINRKTQQELAEMTRICPHVSVLIDSERRSATAPEERQRAEFKQNCEAIGMECHILQHRALENYFTEAAVQAVKGGAVHALGPYDKPPPGWAKTEDNWRIAQEMNWSDLDGTDLGEFLKRL